jgi:ribonuclease HII
MRRGCGLIAGADEVGRGSWAGPLVAAAVILPLDSRTALRRLAGVRDSKTLSPPQRTELNDLILGLCVSASIGWVSHEYIDREGLTRGNIRALERAVLGLNRPPDALVIDHFHLPGCHLPQACVSKGDALSISVAAASVVAKVFRDRWMERCHPRYPLYGFVRHKGYGTREHREALQRHGPSQIHRRSFEPIAQYLR